MKGSNNNNQIEIVFPNGENIKCDNLIAIVQMNDLVEEFEQLLVGNWKLEELVETKFFLDQMYNEKIKERLAAKDKLIFENIQQKKEEFKEKLKESLLEEERELYNFLELEPEILMSEEVPDDLDEEDLENFFDEIFNTLDDLEEEDEQVNNEGDEKVVDMEKYRNE